PPARPRCQAPACPWRRGRASREVEQLCQQLLAEIQKAPPQQKQALARAAGAKLGHLAPDLKGRLVEGLGVAPGAGGPAGPAQVEVQTACTVMSMSLGKVCSALVALLPKARQARGCRSFDVHRVGGLHDWKQEHEEQGGITFMMRSVWASKQSYEEYQKSAPAEEYQKVISEDSEVVMLKMEESVSYGGPIAVADIETIKKLAAAEA
ncbi:unnamed protein product, partial [Prorocentrum cordatum]